MTVAFTNIRHGNDDGEVIEIKAGDDVKGLPSDVVKNLKKQGLVGDPPKSSKDQDDENAALKARVAELEKKLAEADEKKTPPQTPKQ